MAASSELTRAQLEMYCAVACSQFAERMLWKGFDHVSLPGSEDVLTPAELFKRAKALYERVLRLPVARDLEPHPFEAKLKRHNTGCGESARILIEYTEMLGWAAGVRGSMPPPDSRIEAGFSLALHIVWRGGTQGLTLKPRPTKQLEVALAQTAAWWWRSRVEWYAHNTENLSPDLRKSSKKVIALRGAFIKAVAKKRVLRTSAGDFELSTGGPLYNNYFAELSRELEGLHRPRFHAIRFVQTGDCHWHDQTLATLWEIATGQQPDAAGWPGAGI